MRYAIYARYSSDLQSEHSIEDQIRLCRERGVALGGGEPVELYTDYATSGSHAGNRPALQKLMDDAAAGRFDTLIAEALDRLSRDQEDIAGLYKRLRFAGVRILTLSEGEVDELHIGLKGTMNAMFLRDLAAKVRRGARGRIEKGLSAGGRAYGYRVVRKYDDAGEPIRGHREVDEEQATVVRRIFREYASGKSARKIAAGLNRDGIPSATGGEWSASTINGNRSRRNGMLYNEIYTGMLVYNRVSMVKNPNTGKPVSRPNPPEEWAVVEAPHLRIIDDETWDACQAIKARHASLPAHLHRRPRRLLSGLLACGVCGGSYTIHARDKIRCSTHVQRGTCPNGRTVRVSTLEQSVLGGLREKLMHPDLLAEYVREYHAGLKDAQERVTRERASAERALAEASRKIERIIDHLADGTETPGMTDRLLALEAEKIDLTARLEAIEEPQILEMHPDLPNLYRERVRHLLESLNQEETRHEAVAMVRSLIDRIVIHPREGRGKVDIELQGQLAAILSFAHGNVPETTGTVMVAEGGGLGHYSTQPMSVIFPLSY